ncbi:hypothetical protein I546_1433 [Mycobacterium kansasii 732]|nr:hypothetical protein I546_1433 [Mycobacterium kansasii 732]
MGPAHSVARRAARAPAEAGSPETRAASGPQWAADSAGPGATRAADSTRQPTAEPGRPRRPVSRRRRDADLEDQPWPPQRITGGDVLATADHRRGHPHAVQIGAVSAAVDHHPVAAVEPQHEVLT